MKRKTFLATIAAVFFAKPAIAQTTYRNGYCPTCGTKGKDAPKFVSSKQITTGHPVYNTLAVISTVPVYDRVAVIDGRDDAQNIIWFADFCDHCGTLFRTKKER